MMLTDEHKFAQAIGKSQENGSLTIQAIVLLRQLTPASCPPCQLMYITLAVSNALQNFDMDKSGMSAHSCVKYFEVVIDKASKEFGEYERVIKDLV